MRTMASRWRIEGGEALRELAASRAMLGAHGEVELPALCDVAKALAAEQKVRE